MTTRIKTAFKPWPGKMTARERFLRQMNFQSFDRSFNMEFGYWDDNFTEWKLFRDNHITCNEEADEFFQFDPIRCIGANVWLSPPFEHKVMERRGNTNILQNGDGLLAEVPADGHATIPHYLQSSIVTPDDWKRCKEERMNRHSPERVPDVAALRKQHPNDRTYPLGIWCGSMIGKIRDILTFEGLAYACCDYPDMVEDMVETCCRLVEDSLDRLLPHFQFDYAAGWEDICFKNGPLVTVGFFRDIIMPRYKRIRKKLDQYGIELWYMDCDGDVRPILPYFLEGGVNCLFPFEVMGCAHPGELLDQYRGQLRIMGGVDKIQLASGRPAIRKYLDTLVPYVERGGYIPFCDHRCPPNVPEEDYLYYLELKQEMFGLK
ncbi:MAG: Uroporphyrinogen decarboxylase (URO-D) [Lentisphaerae bacterium ADurb.Bin242]|nr:MAG: Uroporphyrinogen decarboxylase (URO-D) [Lentisphaerae bacterium ADurb.Bin242]